MFLVYNSYSKFFFLVVCLLILSRSSFAQSSGGSVNSRIFSLSEALNNHYLADKDNDGKPDYLIISDDDNVSLAGKGLVGQNVIIEFFSVQEGGDEALWNSWVNGTPKSLSDFNPYLNRSNHAKLVKFEWSYNSAYWRQETKTGPYYAGVNGNGNWSIITPDNGEYSPGNYRTPKFGEQTTDAGSYWITKPGKYWVLFDYEFLYPLYVREQAPVFDGITSYNNTNLREPRELNYAGSSDHIFQFQSNRLVLSGHLGGNWLMGVNIPALPDAKTVKIEIDGKVLTTEADYRGYFRFDNIINLNSYGIKDAKAYVIDKYGNQGESISFKVQFSLSPVVRAENFLTDVGIKPNFKNGIGGTIEEVFHKNKTAVFLEASNPKFGGTGKPGDIVSYKLINQDKEAYNYKDDVSVNDGVYFESESSIIGDQGNFVISTNLPAFNPANRKVAFRGIVVAKKNLPSNSVDIPINITKFSKSELRGTAKPNEVLNFYFPNKGNTEYTTTVDNVGNFYINMGSHYSEGSSNSFRVYIYGSSTTNDVYASAEEFYVYLVPDSPSFTFFGDTAPSDKVSKVTTPYIKLNIKGSPYSITKAQIGGTYFGTKNEDFFTIAGDGKTMGYPEGHGFYSDNANYRADEQGNINLSIAQKTILKNVGQYATINFGIQIPNAKLTDKTYLTNGFSTTVTNDDIGWLGWYSDKHYTFHNYVTEDPKGLLPVSDEAEAIGITITSYYEQLFTPPAEAYGREELLNVYRTSSPKLVKRINFPVDVLNYDFEPSYSISQGFQSSPAIDTWQQDYDWVISGSSAPTNTQVNLSVDFEGKSYKMISISDGSGKWKFRIKDFKPGFFSNGYVSWVSEGQEVVNPINTVKNAVTLTNDILINYTLNRIKTEQLKAGQEAVYLNNWSVEDGENALASVYPPKLRVSSNGKKVGIKHTNSRTFVLSGKAASGASLSIQFVGGDSDVVPISVNSDGSWSKSVTIPSFIPENKIGLFRLVEIPANDPASKKIVIGGVLLDVISPFHGMIFKDKYASTNPILEGYSEPNAKVLVTINGAEYTTFADENTGLFVISLSNLNYGTTYPITFKSIDRAGNESIVHNAQINILAANASTTSKSINYTENQSNPESIFGISDFSTSNLTNFSEAQITSPALFDASTDRLYLDLKNLTGYTFSKSGNDYLLSINGTAVLKFPGSVFVSGSSLGGSKPDFTGIFNFRIGNGGGKLNFSKVTGANLSNADLEKVLKAFKFFTYRSFEKELGRVQLFNLKITQTDNSNTEYETTINMVDSDFPASVTDYTFSTTDTHRQDRFDIAENKVFIEDRDLNTTWSLKLVGYKHTSLLNFHPFSPVNSTLNDGRYDLNQPVALESNNDLNLVSEIGTLVLNWKGQTIIS